MRRVYGVSQIHGIEIKFASLLDVSSIVVIPLSPDDFKGEERNNYPCVFFDPKSKLLVERRGVRIRLQDTFPNIRENRQLAWICADFAKYVFMKVSENLYLKVVHRTASNELITRVYSTDVENLTPFSKVYEPDSPFRASRHLDIVAHQMENFGEVCINDLLQNYSEWVIDTRHRDLSKFRPPSL